jgi:hypothetical protein
MNIIGICGSKNSGKDLTFELIQKTVPSATRLGLADYLKNVTAVWLDLPRPDMECRELKERVWELPEYLRHTDIRNIWKSYMCVLPTLRCRAEAMRDTVERLERTPYFSIREALQLIGTDFLRTLAPDIHLDVADKFRDKSRLSVITDCRFPNEVEWVQRNGGKVIYIARPEAEAVAYESTHVSERGILDLRQKCDYLLQNDGTVEDLQLILSAILTDMGFGVEG